MLAETSRFAQLAADGLVVLHLLFILFATCGGLLLLRNRKWAYLHLPAAIWAALVEFTGWYCPLTPLENWLRRQSGGTGYESGFVEHYLVPLIYPASLTREMQIGLGLLVLAINLVLYGLAFHRKAPGKKMPPAQGNSGPGTP